MFDASEEETDLAEICNLQELGQWFLKIKNIKGIGNEQREKYKPIFFLRYLNINKGSLKLRSHRLVQS